MAGISTEHLADQIRETNQRLIESSERLADEIHELGQKFDNFRVDVAEKLGAINANLEGFRGRTETAFKVAVWGIGVAATVASALFGFAVWTTWYAAKLDSRVERVESRLDRQAPIIPAAKVP
jgi:hypothetical protein